MMAAQVLARVKREIEKTRRAFDDLLINLLKAAQLLKEDGFHKEAECLEKAAEVIQAKDNDLWLGIISIPHT